MPTTPSRRGPGESAVPAASSRPAGWPDGAGSKLPVLGYTVPNALGNLLITAWGPVIVYLMSKLPRRQTRPPRWAGAATELRFGAMTPREFVKKWKAASLKERSAAQEHFLDLCELVGHGKPAALDPKGEFFCFERGAEKRGGEDGWADVWKRGFFGWEYKGKHKDLSAAWKQLDEYRADLENPPLLVVCDTSTLEIHTSFQNAKHMVYPIALEEIVQPEKLEFLRAVFFEPEKLRPGRISPVVTAEAAKALGELAQRLRARGFEPRAVARFLDRILFALFAEDIGLLPNEVASKLFEAAKGQPELFEKLLGDLFRRMAEGGFFGVDRIPHVNGSLFDDASTLPLTEEELALLASAARLDWSAIDPSIFGTLFERGLDPAKRAQLGAHYTSREDIETLVEPVVMTPLRREWAEVKAQVGSRLRFEGLVKPLSPGQKPTKAMEKRADADSRALIISFLSRLEQVKILDPACGSGNFLYVSLRKLKDLESEVYDFFLFSQLGELPLRVGVGPWQLYGIEINAYAHELAQMTVWIGYLQWLRQHGTTTWKEPVLQAMSNIENKDAILDLTDPANPKEPTWPKVDFIVGNPPFLGGKRMKGELGLEYVAALRSLFDARLPAFSDLCCYWFEKARSAIETGSAFRAGLLATQAIRGGANRKVLERIRNTGSIFWAVSDQEWILEGAAVHVALVAFDDGSEKEKVLDGRRTSQIDPKLASVGDLGSARLLSANAGVGFIGIQPSGDFAIPEGEVAEELSRFSLEGAPASSVLKPYFRAIDLVRRGEGLFVIDFTPYDESAASKFDQAFTRLKARVPTQRQAGHFVGFPYWRFWRVRGEFLEAIDGVHRYLATPRVSKHRVFVWITPPALIDSAVVGFARADDYFFGVLSSRLHEVWALAQGTQLEDRPRYTPTTCFETFPFPLLEAPSEAAIGEAAAELDRMRRAWLNPPEWTKEEVLEFPGSVDGPWKRFVHDPDARGIGTVKWPRIVAKDAESAKKLAKRTLTNLYNERPPWLDLAHRKLDAAVFAAYGWPVDLTDEQILEKLLALNLERAGAVEAR